MIGILEKTPIGLNTHVFKSRCQEVAVNAAEADTLRVGVVQDFDGAAVTDRDNRAGEIRGMDRREEQEEPEERKQ